MTLEGTRATRLYPLPPRDIPSESIHEDLELPPPERGDAYRPYVIINMVASIDGRVALGGKAARIGSRVDRATMRNLRSKADAVMIGAGTLRSERMSLGLDDPSPGPQGPQPLAIVTTKSGDVPVESNLILGEGQDLLFLSPRGLSSYPGERGRLSRPPEQPTSDVDVNLSKALETLKSEHDVDVLLVEGGPTLNHALISRELADEILLTVAPKLLGGNAADDRTILDGPPLLPAIRTATLLSAHLAGDELFLRYALLPS